MVCLFPVIAIFSLVLDALSRASRVFTSLLLPFAFLCCSNTLPAILSTFGLIFYLNISRFNLFMDLLVLLLRPRSHSLECRSSGFPA